MGYVRIEDPVAVAAAAAAEVGCYVNVLPESGVNLHILSCIIHISVNIQTEYYGYDSNILRYDIR